MKASEKVGTEWWRTAVIYQVYPRSFADADGDGMGDLVGIRNRLSALVELGVDAVWLSPFMVSPQRDAGYDVADYRDVDPRFGTLADFDAMLKTAHELGLKVIIDIVPNHSSDQHRWFQEALVSSPGSQARARYLFRDGRGKKGQLAPNNWESVFGGSAWTRVNEADGQPGQWYLHLFDSSQPDFDWNNPEVHDEFRSILRFWLDRGVDGFRIDVAHGLVKKAGLPNYTAPDNADSMGGVEDVPYWGQPGVHEIYRDWHRIVAEYPGDRVLVAEAWLPTIEQTALWVRPDELHQAFNFGYLMTPWDAREIRSIIDESIAAFGAVGAPSTWVLSNHDVIRQATRLAIDFDSPQGAGLGPKSPTVDQALGLKRARAATCIMLALPGSAYLYQGEELGLPEDVDLPDSARQDPTWFRTKGARYGRDGCRVPIPWESNAPAAGFSPSGASWLPQPQYWPDFARDLQRGNETSTLELYRRLLAERAARSLGVGEIVWRSKKKDAVLDFTHSGIRVVANLGRAPVRLPKGRVIIASEPIADGQLPPDTTVWLEN